MPSNSHPAGALSRAAYQVVKVKLSDGCFITTSVYLWNEYLRLGYSRRLRMIGNGKGGQYAAHRAAPEVGQTSGSARTLARTLLVIKLVLKEAAGGAPAAAKGWRARTINGDPLDLRVENLVCVSAEGCRNTWKAVADVKARRKLVAEGKDPNRVYAERRRAALRDLHKGDPAGSRPECPGGQSREDTRARTLAMSPVAAPAVGPDGSAVVEGDR